MNSTPSPKKNNNKNGFQTYKMPMTNIGLQMPTSIGTDASKRLLYSHLVVKRELTNKSVIKQVLNQHANNRFQSKGQGVFETEKQLIILPRSSNYNGDSKYSSAGQDQLLKEYKSKIDEYDQIIRLQEFKIARLQSELQITKNTNQKLASKVMSYESKMNYYLQIPSPQIQQIQNNSKQLIQNRSSLNQLSPESMPSLTKLLNCDNNGKAKKILSFLNSLKSMLNDLKQETQEKMLNIIVIFNEFSKQICNKANETYKIQIEDLQQLLALQYQQQQIDEERFHMKGEVLNFEIHHLDTIKEEYYEKLLKVIK